MIRCVRVQECGGNGVCSAALTCDCAVGYAGDSCGLCADGYNKDGALCLIIGPPPVAPPDSSPVAPTTDQVCLHLLFETCTCSWYACTPCKRRSFSA